MYSVKIILVSFSEKENHSLTHHVLSFAEEFGKYLKYVRNLDFFETPNVRIGREILPLKILFFSMNI